MRNAVLTCIILVLLLPESVVRAQETAPFRLTDYWAYLQLNYRIDQINTKSIGVETDIDDTRFQIELGGSTTSYIYHPKLLQMHISGSLLSDRQNIAREQSLLPTVNADVLRSSRESLRVNVNASLQFLKDKPYPATISYVRDNPIVSTGVEGSFAQETERLGFDFQLRDILPLDLSLDASKFWSFGESLDRIVDNNIERVTLKARRNFAQGDRLLFEYETSVQESRNGDPRRPIVETVRETERFMLTTTNRMGGDGQVRIDQTTSIVRRDDPEVTDFIFAPVMRWSHSPKWQSIYRYRLSETERPESDFENRTEALTASLNYTPATIFGGGISAEFDRSNEVNRLRQKARGLSAQGNIKHKSSVGQLNMTMRLGYRVDDRVSQSPRVIVEEEPVTFVGTAPIPLSRDFVIAETVVVENATGTQTYIEGIDYLLSVIGSTTRIERIIIGSILDGETVLVRSGEPTLPFNSVEAFEIGLREQIPLRSSGAEIFGEARYRRQDEDINPYNQTSLSLSINAPLSSKVKMAASVSRSVVDNLLSEEDSDMIVFNANVTWQPRVNLSIRAEGTYDEDTGGTILRSSTRWRVTANWRVRKISLRLDTWYKEQLQGDLNNDHYQLWLQIRRDLF